MPPSRPDPAPDFRFPKSIRLRARRDYLRVQKHGARVPAKALLVFYRKGNGEGARFGTTVSKKVGNAVTRNRVKRWLREAIRHHHHVLQAPIDVVFIASPSCARSSYRAIEADVVTALGQIAAKEQ